MDLQIKQFKLTNDDEIICEVLEWDNEENASILVRAALKLIQGIDPETKARYFAFRPWMGFQDDPEMMQTLNSGHVISEATPSDSLMKHYSNVILEMINSSNTVKRDLPLDDIYGMDDEELEEYLENLAATMDEEITEMDEKSESTEINSDSKVIKFPKTFH